MRSAKTSKKNLSKEYFQALFYISEAHVLQTIRSFLVAIEKRKYLIPSRTQKSSSSSPMVLYTRVWKSRSLPSFSSPWLDFLAGAFFL